MIAYEEIKRIDNVLADIQRRLGNIRAGGTKVIGPASSTDNAIARWNGTDGETLQDSSVIIDDSGHMTGPAAAWEINKLQPYDIKLWSGLTTGTYRIAIYGNYSGMAVPSYIWTDGQRLVLDGNSGDIDLRTYNTTRLSYTTNLLATYNSCELGVNRDYASGEIGVRYYSVNATYSKIAQSDAEGIASSSDLRIGVDPSLRSVHLLDLADIATDLGQSAMSYPTLFFWHTNASTRLYQDVFGFNSNTSWSSRAVYWVFNQGADRTSGDVFAFQPIATWAELTASAGEQSFMKLTPRINQSGTASYVGFCLDVTETAAVGSADYLMALRVAAADKFSVDPAGTLGVAGHINLTLATAAIRFQGTHGGGNECITYEDAGGTARYALLFPGADVVHLLNRAANGTVEIHANTAVAGAGGDTQCAVFEDDNIQFKLLTFIGDTANANMTLGLTLNQGAVDDEIIAFKSGGDGAHGCTDYHETDTWGAILKAHADNCGIMIDGLSDATLAIHNRGFMTTCNTNRTTAANAAFMFSALKINGTGIGDVDAETNVIVFRARRGGATEAVAIIDEDGDLHLDATSNENVWDKYNDLVLASDYSRVLAARWNDLEKYSVRDLHNADLLTYTPKEESPSGRDEVFIKVKKSLMFALCTFKQIYDKFQKQDKMIKRLEKRLNLLEV